MTEGDRRLQKWPLDSGEGPAGTQVVGGEGICWRPGEEDGFSGPSQGGTKSGAWVCGLWLWVCPWKPRGRGKWGALPQMSTIEVLITDVLGVQ